MEFRLAFRCIVNRNHHYNVLYWIYVVLLQVSKDIVAAETKLLELQEVITANKGVDAFLEKYR